MTPKYFVVVETSVREGNFNQASHQLENQRPHTLEAKIMKEFQRITVSFNQLRLFNKWQWFINCGRGKKVDMKLERKERQFVVTKCQFDEQSMFTQKQM